MGTDPQRPFNFSKQKIMQICSLSLLQKTLHKIKKTDSSLRTSVQFQTFTAASIQTNKVLAETENSIPVHFLYTFHPWCWQSWRQSSGEFSSRIWWYKAPIHFQCRPTCCFLVALTAIALCSLQQWSRLTPKFPIPIHSPPYSNAHHTPHMTIHLCSTHDL